MQVHDHIIFTTTPVHNGLLGAITLNRAAQLNALSHTMLRQLHQQLQQWEHDPKIKAVYITSSAAKAFSAGGDIREIYQLGKANVADAIQFFHDEYSLNAYLHNYPKPYLALLHGITMGGGIGISLHGSYKISAADLVLAMPETNIGFFPDIGSSYLLSRLPHQFGILMGLTGYKANLQEALYCKLIDYYVPFTEFNSLIAKLAQANWQEDNQNNHTVIHACLAELTASYNIPIMTNNLLTHQAAIAQSFAGTDVAQIILNLEQSNNPWLQQFAAALHTKAPTSLIVTLELLRYAQQRPFAECIAMEFKLAKQFLHNQDIYEGVRALLIDKDHAPVWQEVVIPSLVIEKYFN